MKVYCATCADCGQKFRLDEKVVEDAKKHLRSAEPRNKKIAREIIVYCGNDHPLTLRVNPEPLPAMERARKRN